MNNQSQCNCPAATTNGTRTHEEKCLAHRRGAVSEQGGRVGGEVGTVYGPGGRELELRARKTQDEKI